MMPEQAGTHGQVKKACSMRLYIGFWSGYEFQLSLE